MRACDAALDELVADADGRAAIGSPWAWDSTPRSRGRRPIGLGGEDSTTTSVVVSAAPEQRREHLSVEPQAPRGS